MDRSYILSDLTSKLNWLQKNTGYILAGIFALKDKLDECLVLIIPDIHQLIEGDSFIEEEFDTDDGKISILDVRCLKQHYKGNFFNIDCLDSGEHIIINPFVKHILKAKIEYDSSEKAIKDLQIAESKIKNIVHQMIYEDILKRDIIAYQMMNTKTKQEIRK